MCVSLGLDRKILLTEDQIPKNWYCVLPDLPKPLQPILIPETLELVDPKMLEAIFPKELLKQEMSGERFLQIPEEIRDAHRLWRPTPMYRAKNLEKVPEDAGKELLQVQGGQPRDTAIPCPRSSGGSLSREGAPHGYKRMERK